MVDGGWSDRAELHSALHNAGAWADDREPIRRWIGFGFGRFWFGANACEAFGECVRLAEMVGDGWSRNSLTRSGARAGQEGEKAGFGHDFMICMI